VTSSLAVFEAAIRRLSVRGYLTGVCLLSRAILYLRKYVVGKTLIENNSQLPK